MEHKPKGEKEKIRKTVSFSDDLEEITDKTIEAKKQETEKQDTKKDKKDKKDKKGSSKKDKKSKKEKSEHKDSNKTTEKPAVAQKPVKKTEPLVIETVNQVPKEEMYFLSEAQKVEEASQLDKYFGKSYLWSDASSFARTFNGHLPAFLDAVKKGNTQEMQELWDSVLAEDVKQSGQSPEMVRSVKKNQSAFTDDNDIPNNAFHIAAYYNQAASISFLLEMVKKSLERSEYLLILHAPNKEGKSALHIAAYHSDPACMTLLAGVEGVNLDIKDTNGCTPLHIASYYGNAETVAFLTSCKPSLNVQDSKGNTALHYAVLGNQDAAVKHLCFAKCNVNITNNEKKSPLHLATERERQNIADMLVSNGADVSIRYQYKAELERNEKHFDEKEEQEIIEMVKHANRFGYIAEDDEEPGSNQRDKLSAKKEKAQIQLERERAQRWAKMIKKWDSYIKKNPKKFKKRVQKGFPDCLRPQAWKLLAKAFVQDPELYNKLSKMESTSAEQIDLDVNRSARNHVQFRERFGSGQVSLFNILKAYSNYDKEVAYVQGMSDITAFLLMYLTEEDTFWMLVRLLNAQTYNLRGIFLPGFPMLMQHFYVHERIVADRLPKLAAHMKEEGLESAHYLTRWFLLVYINILPFPIVVRIWDMFLYSGYDFIFSVSYSLIKMHEDRIMKSQMDGIFKTFKDIERLDMDPDDFIKYVLKHKIKSKEIRKLEQEYVAHQAQQAQQRAAAKKR